MQLRRARWAVSRRSGSRHLFFQVGSSATLGSTTAFEGNILAEDSIILDSAAGICGRAIALTAAVTMIGNSISDNCGESVDFGSLGFSGGPSQTPLPSTWLMLLSGLVGLGFIAQRGSKHGSQVGCAGHSSVL